MKIKKEFTRISACLLALLCFWMMCVVWAPIQPLWRSSAISDEDIEGYRADTLTIKVGYFGMSDDEYYEKAVFTVDQLRALGTVKATYTFIDSMPSPVIDHAEGVRLADIIDAAGIDMNSIARFEFYTKDKSESGGKYTDFTKTELIDTPRYCYYSLPENFDYETGAGNANAGDIKERVDAIMTLSDDWKRCQEGAEFGSDYMNLNSKTRFRLLFGQTDTYTQNARNSAKYVHTITVTLGGSPTLSLSDSNLEGKVGSVLRTVASVKSAGDVLTQTSGIKWYSSDESIATVDSDGNITIKGEGSAVITATFAGASAQLTVNGTSDPEEPEDNNDSGGQGDRGNDPLTSSPQQNSTGTSGDVTNPVPAKVISSSDIGGVQNWRVYEMASDATPLVPQEQDNPMLPVMGGGAAGILCAGIAGRALKFRKDLNGKEHKRSKNK